MTLKIMRLTRSNGREIKMNSLQTRNPPSNELNQLDYWIIAVTISKNKIMRIQSKVDKGKPTQRSCDGAAARQHTVIKLYGESFVNLP